MYDNINLNVETTRWEKSVEILDNIFNSTKRAFSNIVRWYADPETRCQQYHVCQDGAMFSELCPNGTIYDQGEFSCRSWRNVDCSSEGLERSAKLVEAFLMEQKFVTSNQDTGNPDPERDLPWRNRRLP